MPKKKKVESKETKISPEIVEANFSDESPPVELLEGVKEASTKEVVETQKTEPTDIVKVKVKVGSLHWEGGWFEKGDVFECSRLRASLFESNDVEILEA